ncbi:microcystinase C [Brucella endophytica]|uniref:Microcystinase C n=1 Tax=Brucella endophytica TaxID=1963359 RepID=A0A916WBT1_9HYPH|nr:M81 family metallopeptidase [Brucella endophytica]GGA86441.1 microcystinase C [Brucella endophytica]
MRIAVGGIHTECSTYNPVLAEAHDFTVLRGEELLAAPRFAFLGDYDAEFVPTLHARAIPGGPVSRATYETFKAEFLERLKAALPIDGLYLAMHGAMYVEGMEDAEGDWISAARAVVGEDCPISASYDLHGNVTQRIIDALDMFSTYRTAPHIDVGETMRRSVAMLVRCITEKVKPILLWAPVPVVLPGERTSTEDEPAKSLYARLPETDAIPGIWDSSLMVGYVWADEPRATAAAIFTGTDRAVLKREAKTLAAAYWDAREDFVFGCETGSIEECVARAVASPTAPVVLADSGDNPTGGGVGDRADVLAELICRNAQGVIVAGITDRLAVEMCFAAGEGAERELSIGATLDKAGSRPIRVRCTVRSLHDAANPADRQAVVRIGGIDLVLCAKRRPYHNIADFTALGLDPRAAKIVVVKSGYLSPELAPIANPNLMALSPGVVDQFVERLPRLRKVRPTFPFDRDFAFEPEVKLSARSA